MYSGKSEGQSRPSHSSFWLPQKTDSITDSPSMKKMAQIIRLFSFSYLGYKSFETLENCVKDSRLIIEVETVTLPPVLQ